MLAKYKTEEERYGRYLLSADINAPNPLFEAEYVSPDQLRRSETGAKAQLELLQARVRELSFKGQTIDSIVQLLAQYYTNETLAGRITTHIGIPKAQWFTGGSAADSAAQLVQICLERNKVEELLDAMAQDYQDIFF